MYMLYIDESVDDDVYLLGGILLPSSKYRKYNEDIEEFVTEQLDLDQNIEIHADSIWNGRDEFKNFSMEERATITEKISSFLGDSTLTRFYSICKYKKKGKEIEIYKELLSKLVEKSANYIYKFGGSRSKQLLLIFDRRSDKEEIHKQSFNIQQDIIEQYSSSCCFIDCGYEGIPKYSRLLQSADFIAYWTRQMIVIQKHPTLFKSQDDNRKIELVENIQNFWDNKLLKENLTIE
jgi:hypothetical protein